MIRFLRYIKGYVVFVASGGFTERFLNLCKTHGIDLWNVENDGVKVKACTDTLGFARLSIPLENSGMSVSVLQEKGVVYLAKRYKWRCGAVCGVFIVAFIIWFMSGFIWSVEIVEKDGVKVDNFTESLAEVGVKEGVRKSEIDIIEAQNQLLARHNELNWVSINIFGSKAQVEYTLTKQKTPSDNSKAPCNIVALKNGRITLIECYRGSPAVKEGAYVVAGSLLISGVIVNSDNSEKLTSAKGKVFALTENVYEFSSNKLLNVNLTEECNPCFAINFFGLILPLGKNNGINISETHINLKGNETTLPVGFLRYDSLNLKSGEIELTDDQIKHLLLKKSVTEKRKKYSNTDIKRLKYSLKRQGDNYILETKINCVENIAAKEPILTEKN